ncbi:MAG TPA: hypothetical protein VE996_03340 [Terriglobales bacterium]|nr:hypothetical protein [Terriglobales bacterium]
MDGTGRAVIVGLTQAPSFPSTAVAPPPFPSPGAFSVYVTNLNAAGTGVVYTDFLGGARGEDLQQAQRLVLKMDSLARAPQLARGRFEFERAEAKWRSRRHGEGGETREWL